MPPSSALPKYIQISEMLIRDIAAGHLVDGAKLPPERALAATLGTTVTTLRKALADMEEKGLLERIHGSGNYICAQADVGGLYAFFRLEKVTGGGLPTARVLSVQRMAKPSDAPAFGPSPHAHRIRRIRALDDTPVALEEIWLDATARDEITPQDLSESLYLFYRRDLNLIITQVEDRIGTAEMPEWTPSEFHLKAASTQGYIERISKTSTGARVEYSRTWFDSKTARYIARMGRG